MSLGRAFGRWWPGAAGTSVPPGFPGPGSAAPHPQPRPDLPEPQPEAPKPEASRVARLARSSAAYWPGRRGGSVPPGFPGRDPGTPAGRLPRVPAPDPRGRRRAMDAAAGAGADGNARANGKARADGDAGAAPAGRRWPLGLRTFGSVVTAVYTALADPVAPGDAAARDRRVARIRRAGRLAAGGALTAVLVYSTFPVRTYLDQREATQRARERLEVLSEENQRLAERAEELRDPETVEEIARRDYGLVPPGEEPYGVLPPPSPTTTMAPTTTTTVPHPE